MLNAVDSVAKARIGSSFSGDWFVAQWQVTNAMQDLANATSLKDYEEDEWTRTRGGVTRRPLRHITPTTIALNNGSDITRTGSASACGSDYFVYNMGTGVTKVEIAITAGVAGFAYDVVAVKGSNCVRRVASLSGRRNFNYSKSFVAGDITRVILAIGGNPPGGSYGVNARGSVAP